MCAFLFQKKNFCFLYVLHVELPCNRVRTTVRQKLVQNSESEESKRTARVGLTTPVSPAFESNQLKPQPTSRMALQTRSWAPPYTSTIAAATTNSEAFYHNAPKIHQDDSDGKYDIFDIDHKNFVGLMRPRGAALRHPAAEALLDYATKGCPVDCGRDWTRDEIEAAIRKGNSKTVEENREAAECI